MASRDISIRHPMWQTGRSFQRLQKSARRISELLNGLITTISKEGIRWNHSLKKRCSSYSQKSSHYEKNNLRSGNHQALSDFRGLLSCWSQYLKIYTSEKCLWICKNQEHQRRWLWEEGRSDIQRGRENGCEGFRTPIYRISLVR